MQKITFEQKKTGKLLRTINASVESEKNIAYLPKIEVDE